MDEPVTITLKNQVLSLSGSLTASGVESVAGGVSAHAGHINGLDLRELDLEDSAAVACLVQIIRLLATRVPRLTVCGAPQALAHVLYRTGDLECPSRLHLVDTRQDEPSA